MRTDPQRTGRIIARLRKESDMTQLALASALRISHQAVSKWETGAALPDIEMLLALAELFDTSVDDLLTDCEIGDDPQDNDRAVYSGTMADVVKTNRDVPLLLEAAEEMREEDITDCIQTLGIREKKMLLALFPYLSSDKIAQIVKTLRITDTELICHIEGNNK